MTTAIRGSEIRMVARSRGWKGKSTTPKEEVLAWLEARGVKMADIAGIVSGLRGFSRTGTLPGGSAPAGVSGLSESEVMALIQKHVDSLAVTGVQVDEKVVQKYVAQAVADAMPVKIILEDDKKAVKLARRTHPVFEKVLRLVKAGINVLLVGPAGCGKTTLAEMIAEALARDYGTLHCTSGASESHLTGWLLPIGKNGGAFEYVASEFVQLFEKGNSVFLLDEIDAADPNMLLVINGVMAGGQFHIPHRYKAPHVKRGKNVAIIAAANTFGTGADMMYAGRNQLDAATLDRFYVVRMDYDPALEAEIMGQPIQHVQAWAPGQKEDVEKDIEALGQWVGLIRQRVAEHRLRRVVSTRTYLKAVAARKAGIPLEEVKVDLLAGWTRDELAKVGVE